MTKTKKYITVNRGTIDRNRKRGEQEPPVRVAVGKYGRVLYGHRVTVEGPSTFVYDNANPLPHGARVWIETEASVVVEKRVTDRGLHIVAGRVR